MGKLTANEVKAALGRPGTYQDGDGLILKVDSRGGAAWRLRIQHQGKRRDIGLGSAKLVSLASARAKAAEARKAIREDGRDLLAEKRKSKAAAVTFREAALALHKARERQWASSKHGGQWLATLETYAFPTLGKKPVGDVTAGDIIAAIAEVWTAKPETGRRVRQRICAVLDYAHARGWRATEAPARSLAAGHRVGPFVADTICDGLRTLIGETNFEALRMQRVEVITVSDEETIAAMRLLWNELKLVVEPSSATVLAVVLKRPERFKGRRVGLVLTGGNVDIDALPW